MATFKSFTVQASSIHVDSVLKKSRASNSRTAKLISRSIFQAFERERQREAARIATVYSDDKWSDSVEREVNEASYSSNFPTRSDRH